MIQVQRANKMFVVSVLGENKQPIGDKVYFHDHRDVNSLIQLVGMLKGEKYELKSDNSRVALYGAIV